MPDKKLTPEQLKQLNNNAAKMQEAGYSADEIKEMASQYFEKFASVEGEPVNFTTASDGAQEESTTTSQEELKSSEGVGVPEKSTPTDNLMAVYGKYTASNFELEQALKKKAQFEDADFITQAVISKEIDKNNELILDATANQTVYADKLLKPIKDEFKQLIYGEDGKVKPEFITTNYYGIKTPDLDKIKEFADAKITDEGLKRAFIKSTQANLQSSLDNFDEIYSKNLDLAFEEQSQPIPFTGRDNYVTPVKSVKGVLEGKAKKEYTEKYVPLLQERIAAASSSIDSLRSEAEPMVIKQINALQAEAEKANEEYLAETQTILNTPAYTAEEVKSSNSRLESLYKTHVQKVGDYIAKSQEIENSYNSRLNGYAAKLEKEYQDYASAINQKFNEEYKLDSETKKALDAASKIAVEKTQDQINTNKKTDLQEGDVTDFNLIRPITSFASSLSGMINDKAIMAGAVDGVTLDKIEQFFQPNVSPIKGFEDLSIYSLQESTGSLMGSMMPSVIAGLGTAVVTRNLGTTAKVVTAGMSQFLTVSYDNMASSYREVYDETGSVEKATNAAKEVWEGQLKIAPVYVLTGLKFTNALNKLGTPARVVTGGAIELLGETAEETFESAIQKQITETGGQEGFTSQITPQLVEETFVNVLPTGVMGMFGAGSTPANKMYKAPDLAVQHLYNVIEKEGKGAANLEIATLYNRGKISKSVFNRLSNYIDNHETGNSKSYNAIMVKKDMVAESIELEKDPVKQKLLKEQVKAYEELMERVLLGGGGLTSEIEVEGEKYHIVSNNPIKTIALLNEKEKLKAEIEGKDEALSQPIKERIKAIDEQLISIVNPQATTEGAIEEVTEVVNTLSEQEYKASIYDEVYEELDSEGIAEPKLIGYELDKRWKEYSKDVPKQGDVISFVKKGEGLDEYEGMFSTEDTQGTGLSDPIKDSVDGKRGYFFFQKGLDTEIVMMSPDEYLKTVREGFGTSTDEGLTESSRNKILDGIKKGNKIDMPYLDYRGGKFSQEGRNRAVLAKELGEEKIPVLIARDVTPQDTASKVYDILSLAAESDLGLDEYLKKYYHRDAINKIRQTEAYKSFKSKDEAVIQDTEKQKIAENVGRVRKVKPKNIKGLLDVMGGIFSLNKPQAESAAVVGDVMIETMAKRAGVSKDEMYQRIAYQKANEKDLPQGVKFQVDAFHGSPYQFDKFTTEKIGTGEGAQAFGWGLYFTDLEGIARNYADKLAQETTFYDATGNKIDYNNLSNAEQFAIIAVTDPKKKYETTLGIAQEDFNDNPMQFNKEYLDAVIKFKGVKKGRGATYKVSLHKGKTPSEYTWLEWDKPVSKKTENNVVDVVLKKIFPENRYEVKEVNGKFYILDTIKDESISGGYTTKEKANQNIENLKYLNKRIVNKLRSNDGSGFYEAISGILGGDKNASTFLLENGIDGIKYPAESISRGATSDTARGFNYVVFDENAVSIEEVIKFQKDAERARGAMMMAMDNQAIIYALTDPNVSTPLHELAHVYEHYLTTTERKVVQEWAGTKEWTTETSEKFARGFEKYLAEGKAPTPALQKYFDNFKNWLTEIYNGIKNSDIDLKLNKPMRDIYDTMLAAKPKDEAVTVNNSSPRQPKVRDVEKENEGLTPREKVKQGFIEYTEAMKEKSAAKVKAVTESYKAKLKEVKTAAKDKEAALKGQKDLLVGFANDLVKGLKQNGIVDIPTTKVSTILNQVKKSNTQASVDKAAAKLIDISQQIEKTYTKNYIAKKVKELKSFANNAAKVSRQNGKFKGKSTDPAGQGFFTQIRDVLTAIGNGDLSAIEKKIEDNESAINEALLKKDEDLTKVERDLLDLTFAYDTLQNIENMTVEEVDKIVAGLKDAKRESISRQKDARKNFAVKANKINTDAKEFVKSQHKKLYDQEGNLIVDETRDQKWRRGRLLANELKITEAVKTFYDAMKSSMTPALLKSMTNLNTYFTLLDKDTTYLRDNIKSKLDKMTTASLRGVQKQFDNLDTIVSDNTKFKSFEDLIKNFGDKDFIFKDSNGKEWVLNNLDLMRDLALSRNSVQGDKLAKQGFDELTISKIEDLLGEDVVNFVDKVVEYLSTDYYESVNKVHEKVNYASLPRIENYFPTKTQRNEDAGIELSTGDFAALFNAQTQSALKERIDKNSKVVIAEDGLNFATVLKQHFEDMERFKAYAEGVKEMSVLFKNKDVSQLFSMVGLSAPIRSIVDKSVNPNAYTPRLTSSADKFISNFTSFQLIFKPIQLAKQASSFINALEIYSYRKDKKQTPLVDTLAFSLDFARMLPRFRKEIREAKEISPDFRDRVENSNMYELYSGSRSSVRRESRSKLKSIGNWFTYMGDIIGVMGYKAVYNRDIANGMSKEEALERFNTYNETQQSRRVQDLSPIQIQNNVFLRLFTAFQSTTYLMLNKSIGSGYTLLRDMATKKTINQTALRGFILSTGVANTAFVGVSNIAKLLFGSDDDKEELKEELIKAALGIKMVSSIPLIGSAIDQSASWLLFDKPPRFGMGMGIDPVTKLYRDYKKIIKQIQDDEANWETYFDLSNTTIGTLTGVNESFLKGIIKFMLPEEDNFDALMDLLGISSSYRPEEGNVDYTPETESNVNF